MCARLAIVSLVLFLFASFGAGVSHAQEPTEDGYVGIVIKADDRKSGQLFAFENLNTQHPFVTFPSGNIGKTNKVFENDETVLLIFVAEFSGSSEMFYINKKRMTFTLIEVGALEARVMGKDFRPDVTYGTLK